MFFRQVLYPDLGCASYVLGDAGEAVVVDPRWDIAVYLHLAREHRLRIAHVIDTHDHADHVSGRARLVQATGAVGNPPGEGGLAAGATITAGSVRIQPLPTPGHRPEHRALVVSDSGRAEEPWLLLTGDSLLVGDVARPDLAVEPREGAADLHRSIRRLLATGDHVEVWPAHVGGSLCGGPRLSRKTSSTVGYERRCNPLLALEESDFVDAVTSTVPSRPPNITRIVGITRGSEVAPPAPAPQLDAAALAEELRGGIVVIDSRPPDRFDEGHIAGSINLPVSSPGVGTRAGWALDPLEPVVIIADDDAAARRMESALQAVGFWRVRGLVVADPESWVRLDLPVACADSWNIGQLAERLRADAVKLVDVREPEEWRGGHVAGSEHLPLHRLRDLDATAPPDGRPTAVACAAGIRAAFAASLLRRAGRRDIIRVAGGGIGDLSGYGIGLQHGM